MNEEQRAQLMERLERFPLLRMLILESWFRIAFAGCLLIVVFLALSLPKMWRSSPAGFRPVVKISGLDLVQAWSLKRNGLQKMAAGNYHDANYCWRAAIANNPADPDLFRGALLNHLRDPAPSMKQLPEIVSLNFWLLRLTGTNVVDAQLAAQLFEKYRLYDLVALVLAPVEPALSDPARAVLLKALFHMGEINHFAARWKRAGSQLKSDPDLKVYYAAYAVGWGSPEQAVEMRETLEKALGDPARRVLANRLQLALAAHAGDPDQYRQALKQLEEWKADTLADHFEYWRVLAMVGRKAEAAELVMAYAHEPVTAPEALRLAWVRKQLGNANQAIDFLKRHAREFSYSAEIWILYGNLLIEEKRWEDLRTLALELRQLSGGANRLEGYSYYLEGRSEWGQDRRVFADRAFDRAKQFPFENPAWAFAAAHGLLDLDHPAVAKEILLKTGHGQESNPEYWFLLFSTVGALKDQVLMFNAAEKAYQLQPESPVYANNYAAALLTLRRHPEQAIQITLRLWKANPKSIIAKINHCFALLLNQRTQEARDLLATIDPKQLTPAQASSYYLCQFEVFLNLRQFDRAWEANDHIDRQTLFPSQIKWLEETHRQIPPRAVAKK
jgi:Tfp pilus assembly protein PilF